MRFCRARSRISRFASRRPEDFRRSSIFLSTQRKRSASANRYRLSRLSHLTPAIRDGALGTRCRRGLSDQRPLFITQHQVEVLVGRSTDEGDSGLHTEDVALEGQACVRQGQGSWARDEVGERRVWRCWESLFVMRYGLK